MRRTKITLRQLETFLYKSADKLRSQMDASEYKEYIFGLLFLKRLSDMFDERRVQLRKDYKHLLPHRLAEILELRTSYGDTMFIPPRARWGEPWTETLEDGKTQPHPALKDTQIGIGEMLNKAIAALEDENEALHGVLKGNINFNEMIAGKPKIKNDDLKDLLDHFTKSVDGQGIPLVNDVFEFPDLLGAAYEYLIKEFADSAGKKGGQFYTPPWVVRLMVRLLDPKQRMSIYDPTVGSGGMLIQSSQYVSEQGGDGANLDFHGQDSDGGVVSIAKMNLILHNLQSSHIEFGNTLEEPHNVKDGQLIQFDRVIANPPFAQNWTKSRCQRLERFQYGDAPETVRELVGRHPPPRIATFAAAMGVTYKRIWIRDLKYRWGSCTPGGTLTFNWRILQAPMIVVNYLVVHELAHILEPNHSRDFQNFVAVHVPSWAKARSWLKENGRQLDW